MSGTLGNIHNNINFALNLHYEAMARLQEQASTGSRINRASDDPSAAYQVLGLASQERYLKNYMDTISGAINLLEASSSVFSGIGEDVGIVSTIADIKTFLASITGTGGDASLNVHKQGIKNYLEEMVSYANWNYNGQYLFGGSDTDSAPYSVTRDDSGNITAVTYQGSSAERDIEVSPGVQSSAFYVGDDIFRCHSRGESEFVLGHTGAAAGTGTSTVTGYSWLTITGTAGNYTLTLDGGTPVTGVDGTDANLAVTDADGKVLYVDTTNITGTGVELVSNTGTHDIFDTLITIGEILENENNFTDGQLKALEDDAYGAVVALSDRLSQISVTMGMKISFLETIKGNLDNIKYNAEQEKTSLEEADIAQLAIDISRREVLYEMSLSVAAKLMSLSLLDFIS